MGVNLKDLIDKEELEISSLKGKVVVFDTMNLLYQFLTTIRQQDGTSLTDSHGNVTSHLNGLFFRITKLMTYDIKMVFVFDGKKPELKQKEIERRQSIKDDAQAKYDVALKEENIEDMKKYASRTVRLTSQMIEEAKTLLTLLGLPVIQSPSEGDAQAAYLVKKGDAYAAISQDYDTLLHGATNLVRNLSIAGKKKRMGKLGYETIKPQIIYLPTVLKTLEFTRDQLIALAMLIGTDYNVGGIKGIGPQKALKLLKTHNDDFETLFGEVKWDDYFDYPWIDVMNVIKNMAVTDDYELKWGPIQRDELFTFLVDEHDFSKDRVESSLDKVSEIKNNNQKGLSDFF